MSEDELFDVLKYHIVIKSDGTKHYYNQDGLLHRDEGPAILDSNGDIAWALNGKLHRIDGPAIVYVNGNQCWFLDGVQYTEEEYNEEVKKYVNRR